MNSHRLNGGLLGEFCDRELYAKSQLFQGDPCALQVQLYYDELELCNPLGSKKHKLGNVKCIHMWMFHNSVYLTFRPLLLHTWESKSHTSIIPSKYSSTLCSKVWNNQKVWNWGGVKAHFGVCARTWKGTKKKVVFLILVLLYSSFRKRV